MQLADLHIFKTVVEEGGIVRAARKLHRVQSSVTARIKQLETSMGAQLFFRDRQRLILSPKGELLLEYANKLLNLAAEARSAVSGQAPSGVLRLGALESTSASRLPGVLSRFHAAYPDVRVELKTGTNDALTQAVERRALDAAFVVETPPSSDFGMMPVFRERLFIITSRQHAPVRKPSDIAGETIIAFPHGCAYRRVLEQWLGRRTLSSTRSLELGSYHAITACVASGTGIALVPESVLAVVNADEVARHPLPAVLSDVTTPFIWRVGEASPAVMALRDLLVAGRDGEAEAVAACQRKGGAAN